MELTNPDHKKVLDGIFKKMPFPKKLFFGVWCCEYLQNTYGDHLNELGFHKAYAVLEVVIAFLWTAVDHYDTIQEEDIESNLKALINIDVGNRTLDFWKHKECGVLKVMECVEMAISFLQNKKFSYIRACAFFPLDVLDSIVAGEGRLNGIASGDTSGHPLLLAEFKKQVEMIEYLEKANALTSGNKWQLRI
jgi:hypothetical protein